MDLRRRDYRPRAHRTAKDELVEVRADVTVGGNLFTKLVPQTYTAKTGKSGKAKQSL